MDSGFLSDVKWSDNNFNYNYIQFSDEPSYADEGCTNNTLIHASASNKRRMLEKVKNIRPERRANFTKALIEAFELFMSVG